MNDLPVEEALRRMLDGAGRLGVERVALGEALGRTLAEDVIAVRSQPPFRAAVMDGWAVRSADLAQSGAMLRIVGESAAARPLRRPVGPGETARISTGAPVPDGADRVVMQEAATRSGDTVAFEQVDGRDHIRQVGVDFDKGRPLLRAGVRLDSWRIGLAASAGAGELTTARRPKVALLSTGDELAAPGGPVESWSIYESNGPAVSALTRTWGGEVTDALQLRDDLVGITAAAASLDADLIVTVGGASVGDHDLVKPALERLGLQFSVLTVRVRPGKPTWFGQLGDGRRVLGLPGNPASALVCAELFLRPLLAALQGGDPALPMRKARLAVPLEATGPREHWLRARLSQADDGMMETHPFPDQDSSLVSVLAEADVLLRRPADSPRVGAGAIVDVLPLARL